MSDRSVTVRISAQDNFSATVDRYNQKMGQAEDATRRVGEAGDAQAGTWGRLSTAIGGAIAAIGVQRVISFAEDFNALGTQVQIAERTFNQLTGTLGDSGELLARMQMATGGIVDDMTLMSGATRLLSMGLAENSDEVARLTELAVRLGGAMGNDAQTSIENFSLLLANESILRLDTFGISAARVRERIEELTASGEAANRSEAFRLAVLEVGAQSLDRLGEAASAAETPLARLQTRLTNFAQDLAADFTIGVNALVAAIENAPAIIEAAVVGVEQYQVNQITPQTGAEGGIADIITQQFLQQFPNSQLDPAVIRDLFVQGAAEFQRDPMLSRFSSFDQMGAELLQIPTLPGTELGDEVAQALTFMQSYLVTAQQALDTQEQIATEAEREAEFTRLTERQRAAMLAGVQQEVEYRRQLEEATRAQAEAQQQISDLTLSFSNMSGLFAGDRGDIGGTLLFTQEELDASQQWLAGIDAAMSRIEDMHEQGIIKDAELANAQQLVDAASAMADQIERGRDAFVNMTLPQALGEGAGNLLFGGIGDEVLRELQERGTLDADALQQAADAYNLAAGRITESSIVMRDTVTPILARIAEVQGIQAAIQRTGQVENFLQQMQLGGVNENGFVAQAGLSLSTGTAFGVDFQSTLIEPFSEAFDEIRTQVMGLGSETEDGAAVLEGLPSGVDQAIESAGELQGILDEMASRDYTIHLKIDDSALANVESRLAAMGASTNQQVARTVRDNGGRVPGADNRGRGTRTMTAN